MSSISSGLGSGAVSEVELRDVLHEDWAEFLTIDLKLNLSAEFEKLVKSEFHCPDGICAASLPLLNEEFNLFRGLFPLKVYIGGPPAVGKTHYANKLASSYGIPHLTIAEMIEHAKKEKSPLGDKVRKEIEKAKDVILDEYEKTRKKKDADLNRDDLKPRLTDAMVQEIVKARIESPACMNKGFILDGYPRNRTNARYVFYDVDAGVAEQEGEEDEEAWADPLKPKGRTLNEKVLPQYAVMLDAEDAFLKARVKEVTATGEAGQSNWSDKDLDRRLKANRESNAGPTHLLCFFQAVIGAENCLSLEGQEALESEKEVLKQMTNLTEQNGKPCCLNLITEADNKFLKKLQKEEEVQNKPLASVEGSKEDLLAEETKGDEDQDLTEEQKAEKAAKTIDSEEEDEVGQLIRKEEEELLKAEKEAEERKRIEAEEAETKKVREAKEAARLEEIRQ